MTAQSRTGASWSCRRREQTRRVAGDTSSGHADAGSNDIEVICRWFHVKHSGQSLELASVRPAIRHDGGDLQGTWPKVVT